VCWVTLMRLAGVMKKGGVNEVVSTSQWEEIVVFNNFVRDMEVEDLKVLGRRYSWYHPNERSMSRIDRVLVSE